MSANIELIRGRIYRVSSSRKGTFEGMFISACDTWATFEITAGKAKAMLEYNERHKGEEVTVRRSFCTFAEQHVVQHLPADDTEGGAL